MKSIFLFLIIPMISFAQAEIDVNKFFDAGALFIDISDKSSTVDMSFPWIEQYEFRTETEDFNANKQEYLFRISPSSPAKRNAQKDIYEWIKNAPDFKLIKEACDNWIVVHQDWLKLYLIELEIQVLEDLGLVLQDRQRIYEKLIGSYDFELQKLIKLQGDKNDLAIRFNALKTEKEIIVRKYGFDFPNLDFSNFPSISLLAIRLNSNSLGPKNERDEEAKFEKELLTKELELERAQEKQLLDFAQLRYQGPHSDMFSEKLALGIGLRLNNSGNRKLKIQELLIEKENIDRDHERELKLRDKEWGDLNLKLQKLLVAYDYFQNLTNQEMIQLNQLGEKLINEEKYSPLVLLDIEERKIQNSLDKIKLQKRIYEDYLNLVELSGSLCAQPFEIKWK